MGFMVRVVSLFFTKVKSPFAYEHFIKRSSGVAMWRFPPPVVENTSPMVSNKRENIRYVEQRNGSVLSVAPMRPIVLFIVQVAST